MFTVQEFSEAFSRIFCTVLVTTSEEGHSCHREGSEKGYSLDSGVNEWNGLPRKMVAAETVNGFKLELGRYLEAVGIELCMDFFLQDCAGLMGLMTSSCI